MFRHRLHPRRGFTFIELMMGMIVTALVLSALATFMFGVADQWTHSESAQSAYLSGNMAMDRITRAFRSASIIDPNTTTGTLDNSGSPAACMFWHDDNADGVMQASELTLLEYDPSTQNICEYAMPTPTTPAATAAAAAIVQQLPTPAVFIATNYVAQLPIAHNIAACEFLPVTVASGERPTIEVVLNVLDPQTSSTTPVTTLYGTVTLRRAFGSSQ